MQLADFPHHTIRVRYATEHRCGLVVHGPGLSDSITGTDPLQDDLPLRVSRWCTAQPRVVLEPHSFPQKTKGSAF